MEDDGTVTLMIRLSQISSMPFQVTVNVTAVGKYTVPYGGLTSRGEFFMDQLVKIFVNCCCPRSLCVCLYICVCPRGY